MMPPGTPRRSSRSRKLEQRVPFLLSRRISSRILMPAASRSRWRYRGQQEEEQADLRLEVSRESQK